LLVEPAATNLVLRSEEFDNASWSKNRSTITANALTSPKGTTDADYIVEDTATNTHEVVQTATVASGISYTLSVYAKADTRTNIALVLAGSAFATGGNGQAIFNLLTGVVTSAINGATATISNAGNGWYRCSITKTSVTTSAAVALQLVDGSNNTSYTGDGTSRASAWGAQLETGSVATSYIPTVAATATRNADVISKTGVSGFIGQTEGTIYAEVDLRASATARRVFLLSDGTAANEIRVTASALNLGDLQFAVRTAGTLQVNSFSPTNVYLSGTFKIAAAYKNADYALYVNGVQVLVSTASGSLPSCSRIDLGSQLGTSNFLNDRIRTAAIYPTRLTNSQLLALTTL
jgi:hypothetical protein